MSRAREVARVRVTVLGASGFIGRRLCAALRARGDAVVEASLRDPAGAAKASADSNVVVNLAGAPVSVRWTRASQGAMTSSRVDLPRRYLTALKAIEDRPRRYVSASAIGYYGTSRDATFVEASPPGDDFLAHLCVAWEAVADEAAALGMRVAKVRTGLVLGPEGGVLAKLLPLFRLGLGGVVADGNQWYSWIHVDDQVGIYLHAIDGADGAFNATAPKPVTNRDFTRALARAVHRPAILPVPAFGPKLLLGEGALIVNQGQRVLPQRTLSSGYVFRHPDLAEALSSLVT
ncbi:MAG TPA: TIGR01777 family oxidoreductase [Candidatus Elarobacter sp.]|nr:TIGR01777 family oxidoreductase [Candidatus Elarobacter sp.]